MEDEVYLIRDSVSTAPVAEVCPTQTQSLTSHAGKYHDSFVIQYQTYSICKWLNLLDTACKSSSVSTTKRKSSPRKRSQPEPVAGAGVSGTKKMRKHNSTNAPPQIVEVDTSCAQAVNTAAITINASQVMSKIAPAHVPVEPACQASQTERDQDLTEKGHACRDTGVTGQVEVKAETPKVERKCKKKLDYSHSQGELDAKKLKKPAEATPERAFLLREVDPTNILHMRLRSSHTRDVSSQTEVVTSRLRVAT